MYWVCCNSISPLSLSCYKIDMTAVNSCCWGMTTPSSQSKPTSCKWGSTTSLNIIALIKALSHILVKEFHLKSELSTTTIKLFEISLDKIPCPLHISGQIYKYLFYLCTIDKMNPPDETSSTDYHHSVPHWAVTTTVTHLEATLRYIQGKDENMWAHW